MAQYHWLDGNLAVFILFGFYSVIGGWIVIYIGQVLWQLGYISTHQSSPRNEF